MDFCRGGGTSLEAAASQSEASREAVSDENAEAAAPALQSAQPAPSTATGGESAASVVTAIEIETAEDLRNLADKVNKGESYAGKTVVLAADIDLGGLAFTPIGTVEHPFEGTFDGQGHTIANLRVDDSAYAGLFGCVASPSKGTAATIKDLTIDGVTISNTSLNTSDGIYVGALAGSASRTFIESVAVEKVNITVAGMATWVELAGLVGESSCVMVGGCSVDGLKLTYSGGYQAYIGGMTSFVKGFSSGWTVEGANANSLFSDCSVSNAAIDVKQADGKNPARVGGFAVGGTSYTESTNGYSNCRTADVDITCRGGGEFHAGGFLAYSSGSSGSAGVSSCESGGTITHTGTNDRSVFGGFVGLQGGRSRTYSDCHAVVDIVANGTVGGFVGKTEQYLLDNDHANHYVFTDCSASGDVEGDTVGGFAGEVGCYDSNRNSRQIWVDFKNCVASGNVTGNKAAGFLGGIANENASFTDPDRTGVTLRNCKAQGVVLGASAAAGLIADVANKNVSNNISTPVAVDGCHATLVVVGENFDTNVALDFIMNETASDESAFNAKGTVTGSTVVPPEGSSAIKNDDGTITLPEGSVETTADGAKVLEEGAIVKDGEIVEPENPLPPSDDDEGDEGGSGKADGSEVNGNTANKPVEKTQAVAAPLAQTGDCASLALAGLGAAAVVAAGVCIAARRKVR